ncbi:MAG TPA: hypothetical protein GXX29_13665 [Firmicutes bacterium]|nr:hypothetical protein [Bacillota bacterium]
MKRTTSQEIAALLGPTGPLAAAMANFECRTGQQEMAKAAAEVIQEGGILLVEAGTGTGKSLAYLTPAVLRAVEKEEKVVVSTNTINLQEQLLYKDIPFVKKHLAPDLISCLVKGWRNYLCLYRYWSLSREVQGKLALAKEEGENSDFRALDEWVRRTSEGSLSEWAKEPEWWPELCAESDLCLREDCPYKEKCFVMRARAQMEAAHLLVVNHYLLLADAAVRRVLGYHSEKAVLPAYSHLIMDEAHHVKDAAVNYMGVSLSEYAVTRLLNRLHRPGRKGNRGLLALISAALTAPAAKEATEMIVRQCLPALNQLEDAAHKFFVAVRAWFTAGEGTEREQNPSAKRIKPGRSLDRWRHEVLPPALELEKRSIQLELSLKELGQAAQPHMKENQSYCRELDLLSARFGELGQLVRHLGEVGEAETAYWVESDRRGQRLKVTATPLDVAPFLAEWLSHVDSVVLTSATLAIAKSFTYMAASLGLKESGHDVHEVLIDSPFDYRRQVLLSVPLDIPDPNHPSYPDALAAGVSELLKASRGRAFVLFTSYALLRRVAAAIAPLCREEGWPLYIQGENSRHHMLEGFKAGNSVLLGTDSFWEGVDVPGEALSSVILTRLPFRVPDNPYYEAFAEALKKKGGDPFYEYAMPEAVLKLKQGFGRLVRTRTDKGTVIICDNRILKRSYGAYFRQSLPECSSFQGSLAEVCLRVKEWLQS